MNQERAIAYAFAIVAVIIFIVATVIKTSIWNECRVDHSRTYCMALISK